MKFFASVIVVMLWAAGAGPAGAAITLGNAQGGSSLFLSVWDNTRQVSYTRNLGYTLNTFLPSGLTTLATDGSPYGTPVTGDKTPAAGLSIVFPPGSSTLFETAFSGSNPANLRWNVAAYDNLSNPAAGLSRVITTASAAPQPTNAGIDNIVTGGWNYLGALISDSPILTQDAVTTFDPNRPSYAGNANWGNNLNGGGIESAATGLTSTIAFYYLARSTEAGAGPDAATLLPYGANGIAATWSLAADGTATYSLAAVPLPASAWLFMAGVGAFAGLARRGKAAKKTVSD